MSAKFSISAFLIFFLQMTEAVTFIKLLLKPTRYKTEQILNMMKKKKKKLTAKLFKT